MENRALIVCFLLLFVGNLATAQSFGLLGIGAEIQGYPAGFILGIRGDVALKSNWTANAILGYNFARRGDLGENDDEKGGGAGFSLGSHYYFRENFQGFFIGPRIDFWFMEIDWFNDVLTIGPRYEGTTKIKVLQPLAEGGYTFLLGEGGWSLTAKVSLGFEINVKTDGKEVGEGPISLLGATLTRRLRK